MDRKAGVSADGGGGQEDGEAGGHVRGALHDPVKTVLDGVGRDQEQGEGGADVEDGQHAGQGQHHQGDGQGGHGGEGREQLHRCIVQRKVRGMARDGRRQLSIVGYFSKSGKGDKSSAN